MPNLPPFFKGFTIIHLSDLHYGFLVPKLVIEAVAEKCQRPAKKYHCVRDYVHEDNNFSQIDKVWPILSQLSAPQGVYSVLGNHDHWADTERSLYWLCRSGQDLRHKTVSIGRDGQRIWRGGTGDLWEDDVRVDRTFEGVPEQECKILLAHNPDTADTGFTTRIDLMLSGHTHGGPVRIPFIGAPVLSVNNKRYTSGYIRTDRTALFISRGIGGLICQFGSTVPQKSPFCSLLENHNSPFEDSFRDCYFKKFHATRPAISRWKASQRSPTRQSCPARRVPFQPSNYTTECARQPPEPARRIHGQFPPQYSNL